MENRERHSLDRHARLARDTEQPADMDARPVPEAHGQSCRPLPNRRGSRSGTEGSRRLRGCRCPIEKSNHFSARCRRRRGFRCEEVAALAALPLHHAGSGSQGSALTARGQVPRLSCSPPFWLRPSRGSCSRAIFLISAPSRCKARSPRASGRYARLSRLMAWVSPGGCHPHGRRQARGLRRGLAPGACA